MLYVVCLSTCLFAFVLDVYAICRLDPFYKPCISLIHKDKKDSITLLCGVAFVCVYTAVTSGLNILHFNRYVCLKKLSFKYGAHAHFIESKCPKHLFPNRQSPISFNIYSTKRRTQTEVAGSHGIVYLLLA